MLIQTTSRVAKVVTSEWSQEAQGRSLSKLSEWIEQAKSFTMSSLSVTPICNLTESDELIRRCMVYVGHNLLVGCIGSRTAFDENRIKASHGHLGQPKVEPADLSNADKIMHGVWKAIQEKMQEDEAMIIRFIDQVVSGQLRKTHASIQSKLGSEAAIIRAIMTADDTIHRLLAEGLVDAFVGMEAGNPTLADIQVGLGREISRYECSITLQYYVDAESFQSCWSDLEHLPDSSIEDIAHAFDRGASQWENKCLFTEDIRRPRSLARSFFPNAHPEARVLWVYPPALPMELIGKLNLIFEHEIGHILGLRHEDPEKDEAKFWPSVTFGLPNSTSIMRPTHQGMGVSDQDVTECTEFYTYPQAEFKNLPIVTVTPEYPTPK